jgi:hypothetical protein
MIYILIPNEITDFFQIRVFDSFSNVEQIMKQEAQRRPHPDWCRVFAYEVGLDEYIPCWIFTVTKNYDVAREPIRSP